MNGGMPLAWLHIKAILKGQRLLPLTALCIYTIKEELFLYLCGEKVKRRLHRSINYQRSEISGDPMIGSPPQSWFPNVLRAVSFAGLARRLHARSDKADRSHGKRVLLELALDAFIILLHFVRNRSACVLQRSEERRVGKEGVITCRSRWG